MKLDWPVALKPVLKRLASGATVGTPAEGILVYITQNIMDTIA